MLPDSPTIMIVLLRRLGDGPTHDKFVRVTESSSTARPSVCAAADRIARIAHAPTAAQRPLAFRRPGGGTGNGPHPRRSWAGRGTGTPSVRKKGGLDLTETGHTEIPAEIAAPDLRISAAFSGAGHIC